MKTRSILILFILASLELSRAASGQTPVPEATISAGGVAVFGNGDVVARPDVIEVSLRISGSGELTNDAISKHRDARQRSRAAFEALKLDGLTIDDRDVAVRSAASRETYQMMMNGMQTQNATRPQNEVSSTMRIRLARPSDMSDEQMMKLIGKLLDTAQDSAAKVGPSDEETMMAARYGRPTSRTLVRFVLLNPDSAREEAYKKAVADARARAERLAKLEGIKLGAVTSIQETAVSDDLATRTVNASETSDEWKGPRGEIAADTMSGAIVRVKLQVRFAIDRATNVAAQ